MSGKSGGQAAKNNDADTATLELIDRLEGQVEKLKNENRTLSDKVKLEKDISADLVNKVSDIESLARDTVGWFDDSDVIERVTVMAEQLTACSLRPSIVAVLAEVLVPNLQARQVNMLYRAVFEQSGLDEVTELHNYVRTKGTRVRIAAMTAYRQMEALHRIKMSSDSAVSV